MSTIAGESLLEKMEEEGTAMKAGDLTKIYTGATNQAAANQRWNQPGHPGGSNLGMTAIAQLLQGEKLAIEDRSPANDVVDVTLRGSPSARPN